MKKLLSMTLVLLLIFSLGACSKDDEPAKEEDPNATTEQAVKQDSGEKVPVEKGDWITTEKEPFKLEVRKNWIHEIREYNDIEYFYFDESRVNYAIISYTNQSGIHKNSKAHLTSLLFGNPDADSGTEFEINEITAVGNGVEGLKLKYTEERRSTTEDGVFHVTEFYTFYEGKLFWVFTSFREDYVDDYKDDVEHVLNSLQTISGEPNPIVPD